MVFINIKRYKVIYEINPNLIVMASKFHVMKILAEKDPFFYKFFLSHFFSRKGFAKTGSVKTKKMMSMHTLCPPCTGIKTTRIKSFVDVPIYAISILLATDT